MSGMFDTKTDKVKRKQELTLKEQKAKRKRSLRYTLILTVFVLAVAVALLLNSNLLRRTLPVVTIDGMSFTTAQFEYFYNNEFMTIENEARNQGWDFMLPDRSRLSATVYDSSTGETWAQMLTAQTLDRMSSIVAVYNAATAAGFTLSEESLDQIDSEIQMYEFYAQMSQFPSLDSYIQQMFGAGINENIMREIMQLVYTVEDYVVFVRDSFSYADEQLDNYYAEKADILDIFKYRALLIDAGQPEADVEDYDTALEEAIERARETAKVYAAAITSEDDFLAAAIEYDEISYSNPDSSLRELQGILLDDTGYTDFAFSSWLRESGRTEGDVTTIDTPSGAAVLYFISRDDNSYNTTGMRQILISRENVSPYDYPEGEDDPDYIEAKALAAQEADTRAMLAEQAFADAGRTEQALIDIMPEHSDDTTEGGLYEDISKYPYQGMNYSAMRVVPEIEQWLFDSGRTAGDSMLIETEAYGYHLIYFTGYGRVFSRAMADDQLRTEDSNAWLDSLEYAQPVKHGAFILVST